MDRLTDKQLAYTISRTMKARKCSMLAACEAKGWDQAAYLRAYRRLRLAGLLNDVMRSKYEDGSR